MDASADVATWRINGRLTGGCVLAYLGASRLFACLPRRVRRCCCGACALTNSGVCRTSAAANNAISRGAACAARVSRRHLAVASKAARREDIAVALAWTGRFFLFAPLSGAGGCLRRAQRKRRGCFSRSVCCSARGAIMKQRRQRKSRNDAAGDDGSGELGWRQACRHRRRFRHQRRHLRAYRLA